MNKRVLLSLLGIILFSVVGFGQDRNVRVLPDSILPNTAYYFGGTEKYSFKDDFVCFSYTGSVDTLWKYIAKEFQYSEDGPSTQGDHSFRILSGITMPVFYGEYDLIMHYVYAKDGTTMVYIYLVMPGFGSMTNTFLMTNSFQPIIDRSLKDSK